MDAPFDLVLTLIPIALLIAVQIYASRKKKAEEAERAKLASFLVRAASGGAPAEKEFDAHALVPDDEDFNGAAKSFGRTYTAPRIEGGAYRSPASPVASAVSSNVPPRLVSDVPTEIVESVLSDSPPVSVGDRPGARTADRFFARLEKLSPLKRAIVMAEVLGKPKGL